MKISLDKNNADFTINTYDIGSLQINERVYTTPIIISKDRIVDWPVNSVTQLTDPDFEPILETGADIILLGTGQRQIFPPRSILKLAADKRLGLEVMDTAAACRTYNVLLSEDRHVCAALFMIDKKENGA